MLAWMVSVHVISCVTYEQVPPQVEKRSSAMARPTASSSPGSEVTSRTTSAKRTLSPEWAGSYGFIDKGPHIGGINTLVGYTVIVRPDGSAQYAANGYQTDVIAECIAVENGSSLAIVVQEMKPNSFDEPSVPSYPKGARLFVLTRTKGLVVTTWQAVKPAFEGCASGHVCFQREK